MACSSGYDRAVDEARNQISEQGPKIVEHVLSYGIDTYQNDFKTAQALVTDGYRDQLIKQQQAVSKKPTTNQYYAVSSAILSAGTDQATMLLALQGQRGVDANTLRFITATVRVDFVKSSDGKWQLSNLTVLKSLAGRTLMSPRRKIDAAERFVAGDYFKAVAAVPRRVVLAVIACVTTVLVIAAIVASTYLLVQHEKDVASQAKSAAVLGYVKEFMRGFTAVDPFHANAYVEKIAGSPPASSPNSSRTSTTRS